MPAISASAPGKIILFGEHAVVYNRPAIAVPVLQVKAKTTIVADPLAPAHTVWIDAPVIGLSSSLHDLDPEHPIRFVVQQVMQALDIVELPSARIKLTSTIPLAAGLGSSSASAVSLARALSAFLGHPLTDDGINRIAFESEKIHHGHPSGIDNTVTTYAKPIFFIKDQPIEWLEVGLRMIFVISDTGQSSQTGSVVADVRRNWTAAPEKYEAWFDEIGACAFQAKQAIRTGQLDEIGKLMTRNHELLQKLDVSSPELDRLVDAAISAGALGAKLSGGGRGGNSIALAGSEDQAQVIAESLKSAGAVSTLITIVPGSAR